MTAERDIAWTVEAHWKSRDRGQLDRPPLTETVGFNDEKGRFRR